MGKTLTLPVLGRQIPVIADVHVDKDFGTGALKVTPAHDFTDFDIGKQHGLEAISILDEQARMTSEAGPYAGMDRYACRTKLVEDLQQTGALIRTEPYKIMLGHCYRCRTVVEPFLSYQWFVKIKPLAARTRKVRRTCLDVARRIWWTYRQPAQSLGHVVRLVT